MRATRLIAVLAATAFIGCAPEDIDPVEQQPAPVEDVGADTERLLRENFAEQAALILDADEADFFSEGADGFLPLPNDPGSADETYRRGLKAVLPADGTGAVRFTVGDGFAVEVRETGATGVAALAGPRRNAIVYKRPAGASIWVSNGQGLEEWLLVSSTWQGAQDRAQERVIAEWTVTGARMAQQGSRIDLIDEAGIPRMQVSAPAAYAANGKPVATRLEARGERLSLVAKTEGGMLLIDPLWQSVNSMTARDHHTATLLPDGRVMLFGRPNTSTASQAAIYDTYNGSWNEQAGRLPRQYHTATLLTDGRVLVAGGRRPSSTTVYDQTEIYDGSGFSDGPSMSARREGHTATLLNTGRVLVVGGNSTTTGSTLNSAETFNPTTNAWASAGTLSRKRFGHTATLLGDGRVVVIGGTGDTASPNSVEIYSGTAWSEISTSITGRYGHTATLIAANQILVAGGRLNSTLRNDSFIVTISGSTVTTTAAGNLPSARYNHTATLLPDGRVLVTGGLTTTSDPGGTTNAAAVWNPATNTWAAVTNMSTTREGHTATLLPTGKVLIAGGRSSGNVALGSSELYDPASPSWTATGTMGSARQLHALIRHSSGDVGAIGGSNASGAALATTERWSAASGTWTSGPNLNVARSDLTATELRDGTVLVAGGNTGGGTATATAELFNGTGWALVGSMSTARFAHTATPLPNGLVMVAGGLTSGTTATRNVELYDPVSQTWSSAAQMATARAAHTATLLRDGTVLVVGGYNGSTALSSVELYDPATNTWSTKAALPAARYRHAASLLPDGNVLVTGGLATATTASQNVYMFNGTSWSTRTAMSSARALHTSTLLFSGHVLVAGGMSPSAALTTVQLHNPTTNTWETVNALPAARGGHGAVLLADGRVLVSGGRGASLAHADSYLYSDGRNEVTASRPILAQPVPADVNRTGLTLSGFRFQGTTTASSSDQASSPSNNPVLLFERLDDPGTQVVPVSAWTATSLQVNVPSSVPAGTYAVRVVVNGISSADAVTVRVKGDPLGTVCASGLTCESGFCASGVCCDSACNSGCASCKLADHGNTAYPDGYCAPAALDTLCRAPVGACDLGETCDGSSYNCPPDTVLPAGTVCVHDFNPTCKGTCNGTDLACQL